MSRANSSADGGYGWPRYGPVPLTCCPRCQRFELLVRLRSRRTENGNYGQEFVKCQSKPQAGKSHCTFFMWLDDYIENLHLDGVMDAPEGRMMSKYGVEHVAASRADVHANWDMFAAKLKKMNGNLCKIVYIVGAFYASMIVIVFLFFVMNFGGRH